MDKLVIIIVSFILYGMIFIGIGLLFYKEIIEYKMKVKMRYRLIARRKELEGQNKLFKYLDDITGIVFKGEVDGKKFFYLSLFIIFLVSIVGIKTFSPLKAIFTGVVMGTLPILLLKIKIESIRRKSSYEGEKLIGNFMSQYRLSGFNIYETMEKMVENFKDTKVSNRLIMKLLLELRGTGNPLQIEKACSNFSYAVNTNWGRMLSYNIALAAESGMNISSAVEDILIQLREARTLVEERKRMNSESARMVVYLIPFMYIGTVFLSVTVIGMSVKKFFYNQFFSGQGFTMFLMIVFMLLINIVLIESANNQRFDY
jgi:Flp pilus assembly protein TadB